MPSQASAAFLGANPGSEQYSNALQLLEVCCNGQQDQGAAAAGGPTWCERHPVADLPLAEFFNRFLVQAVSAMPSCKPCTSHALSCYHVFPVSGGLVLTRLDGLNSLQFLCASFGPFQCVLIRFEYLTCVFMS